MNIGQALYDLRKSLGLSQKEMASGVISSSFYCKVEKGENNISIERLLQLLERHEVNVRDFFYGIVPSNKILSSVMEKERIKRAFYEKNVDELRFLKMKVKKKELKLLCTIEIAVIENKVDRLVDKLKKDVKKLIFNAEEWNLFSLTIFGNSMVLYELDELNFLVNSILIKYINEVDNLSEKVQKILAGIVINYIYSCFKNKVYSLTSFPLKFLKDLPNIPSMFIYKMLGKYYESIFNDNEDERKIIEENLKMCGYKKLLNSLTK